MFHTVAGVDNGEAMHVLGQEVCGKSLCLSLNFVVNLKLLSKKIKFKLKTYGEY